MKHLERQSYEQRLPRETEGALWARVQKDWGHRSEEIASISEYAMHGGAFPYDKTVITIFYWVAK